MPAKKDTGDGMNVDMKIVRDLAGILDKAGLSEIEVEDGERKIRVARASGGTVMSAPVAAPAPAAAHGRRPPSVVYVRVLIHDTHDNAPPIHDSAHIHDHATTNLV